MSLNGKVVEVFNNPGKGCLNVRDHYHKGPREHRQEALIHLPRFVVDMDGYNEYQSTRQAGQFAFVVGTLMSHNFTPRQTQDWIPLRYNPDIHPFFFNPSEQEVLFAEFAQLRIRQGKALIFAIGLITA